MLDVSWIIEDCRTGKAVAETFNGELCQFVNLANYRVWTSRAWLVEINRRIKAS